MNIESKFKVLQVVFFFLSITIFLVWFSMRDHTDEKLINIVPKSDQKALVSKQHGQRKSASKLGQKRMQQPKEYGDRKQVLVATEEDHEPYHEHPLKNEQPNLYAAILAMPGFDDSEREQIESWLRDRGYHLILGGCGILQQQDYCKMPKDYMLALAKRG